MQAVDACTLQIIVTATIAIFQQRERVGKSCVVIIKTAIPCLIVVVAPQGRIPLIRVQIRKKCGEIDFPCAHALVTKKSIVSSAHSLFRPGCIIVNIIYVERFACRDGDEGVAGQKPVGGRMRLVGPFQNADPLRVASIVIVEAGRLIQIVRFRQQTGLVKSAVAVEVEVVAEVQRRTAVGGHKHRRTRAVKEVGDVLLELIRRQWTMIGVILIIVIYVEKVGTAVCETERINVIGRNPQVKIVGVGGGEDGREQFGLGALQRGIRRQARHGLVGGRRHRALVAAADSQERDRHERDHRKHDQRNDQRNASLLGVSFHGYAAGSTFRMGMRWRNKCTWPAWFEFCRKFCCAAGMPMALTCSTTRVSRMPISNSTDAGTALL